MACIFIVVMTEMKFSPILFTTVINTIGVVCDGYLKDTILLTVNFFKHKQLKFGVFFVCWRKSEIVQMCKMMCDSNISTVYLSKNVVFDRKITYLNNTEMGPQTGFVVDLKCDDSLQLLSEAAKLDSFQNFNKWFVLNHNISVFAQKLFENIQIRMDSDITFVTIKENSTKIIFVDVYNPGFGLGGVVKTNKIGYYENGTMTITNKLSKYATRKNMTGLFLKVGTVITHNLSVSYDVYLQDRKQSNYDSISKLNYNLFAHIKWAHNFSQELIVVNKWFGPTLQGADNGSLAQLLYERKIQFSCCAGLMTVPRLDAIDYLAATYNFSRTCFVFRNPEISDGNFGNHFFKPFDETVWYTLFISFFGIIIVLRLVYWAEENMLDFHHENTWVNAILIILAAICQQGSALLPKYFAGRIVVFCILMTSVILYNYYTSSIVSSLIKDEPSPLKTIAQLAHSQLKVGMENIVYVRNYFEVSTDPDVQYLYRTKVFPPGNKEPFYYSPEEGLRLVQKETFAYHTEPSTGYPIVRKTFEPYQICELNEINFFKPTPLVTMIPKKSQYKKTFGVSYMKLIEGGILKREKLIWQAEKPKCTANVKLSAVGLGQTSALFIFLSFGMMLSLIIFVLEFLFYYKICNKLIRIYKRCKTKYFDKTDDINRRVTVINVNQVNVIINRRR